MCSPASCRVCGKTTWSGCGRHVERAMRDVPESRRCQGHQEQPTETGRTFLDRLRGR
jgi:hypothetical protein